MNKSIESLEKYNCEIDFTLLYEESEFSLHSLEGAFLVKIFTMTDAIYLYLNSIIKDEKEKSIFTLMIKTNFEENLLSLYENIREFEKTESMLIKKAENLLLKKSSIKIPESFKHMEMITIIYLLGLCELLLKNKQNGMVVNLFYEVCSSYNRKFIFKKINEANAKRGKTGGVQKGLNRVKDKQKIIDLYYTLGFNKTKENNKDAYKLSASNVSTRIYMSKKNDTGYSETTIKGFILAERKK